MRWTSSLSACGATHLVRRGLLSVASSHTCVGGVVCVQNPRRMYQTRGRSIDTDRSPHYHNSRKDRLASRFNRDNRNNNNNHSNNSNNNRHSVHRRTTHSRHKQRPSDIAHDDAGDVAHVRMESFPAKAEVSVGNTISTSSSEPVRLSESDAAWLQTVVESMFNLESLLTNGEALPSENDSLPSDTSAPLQNTDRLPPIDPTEMADALASMMEDEETFHVPEDVVNSSSGSSASDTKLSSLKGGSSITVQSNDVDSLSAQVSNSLSDFLHHAQNSSPIMRVASEVLFVGADVKAVIPHAFQNLELKDLNFSQADFSTMHMDRVFATSCDFSRALFFGCRFDACRFVDCDFSGAVLKQCALGRDVVFENCLFQFAGIGVKLESRIATNSRASSASFRNCDFDLCDFDGSSGLGLSSFEKSKNMQYATALRT